MTLLTRKKQLAAVAQVTTAVPSSDLDLAANATVIALDLSTNVDVERIERQLLRDSITSVQDLPGQKAVDITFGVEMKGTPGGAFADGAPAWSTFLQSCGFHEESIKEITLTGAISVGALPGSSSTTFRHGEIAIQATSGARVGIVGDHHNGATSLRVENVVTGTPTAGDVWVGQDSGATVTPTAVPADAGFAWYPVTDPVKSIATDGAALAASLAVGDVIEGATSGALGVMETGYNSSPTELRYRPLRGSFQAAENINRIAPTTTAPIAATHATDIDEQFVEWAPLAIRTRLDGKSVTAAGCRGNVSFNLEVNRPARMDFTFRGVLVDVTDRALIDSVQYDIGNPPLWESAAIGWARNDDAAEMDENDEVTPCLNTLSFDMGVQLAERKCAGATNGLLEIRGSARDATGSMDPEDSFEVDLGWLTSVQNGAVYRLHTTIGDTLGNSFEVRTPGIQVTSGSEGDRDGTATQDLSLRVTGGNLFDLVTTPVTNSAIGGNNELVLFYFTS